MKKPKYKEFDNFVEPVIRKSKYGVSVEVMVEHKNKDQVTCLLNSKELRELADYLDTQSMEDTNK